MVHHEHTITVPIEGNTQICTLLQHCGLKTLHMGRATVLIDIQAIRLIGNHVNLSTQLTEHAGRHLVSSPMSTIKHQFEASKTGTGRHATLAELDIAPCRIIDARSLTNLCRLNHLHGLIKQGLDLKFDVIRQLGALPGKEFDAVIVIRVMRSTNDNARISLKSPREISDRRCRHRPQQHHVHTGRGQARLKRRLEHITRYPRILAHQNATAPPFLAKRHPCRPAQAQDEFRGNGKSSDATTHPIGAEVFTCHCLQSLSYQGAEPRDADRPES